MRHAPEIALSVEEKAALLQLMRATKTPVRLLERAKIVWAASKGKTNDSIARELGYSRFVSENGVTGSLDSGCPVSKGTLNVLVVPQKCGTPMRKSSFVKQLRKHQRIMLAGVHGFWRRSLGLGI